MGGDARLHQGARGLIRAIGDGRRRISGTAGAALGAGAGLARAPTRPSATQRLMNCQKTTIATTNATIGSRSPGKID